MNAQALEAARRYAKKSRADSTWRAYASDWKIFETWCTKAELDPLPAAPHTVYLFLSRQADDGIQASTLTRRLAAIRMVHRASNLPSAHDAAEVAEIMAGIRREQGGNETALGKKSTGGGR